jgi:hypothetical protein
MQPNLTQPSSGSGGSMKCLMKEALSSSSVRTRVTQRHIPENGILHSYRRGAPYSADPRHSREHRELTFTVGISGTVNVP